MNIEIEIGMYTLLIVSSIDDIVVITVSSI